MPSVSAVHIDRALSNLSLFYRNPSYVADIITPTVNVKKESDKYFVYGRENFRVPPTLRADKSETKEMSYALSTDSYFTENYGLHALVSDRERQNSDDALRPDYDTTELLTEALLLDREYRTANLILDSTNSQWGTYSTTHFMSLGAAYDDRSTADFRYDITYAKNIVFIDSRMMPNTLFLPVEGAFIIQQLDQVDELRKYTDSNLLTDSGLPAKVFGLKVYETQSTYDTSMEGDSPTYSETWGNNMVIAFINPNPIGLKTLTFGICFQSKAFQTKKWREEKRESDCIEVTHAYDEKIVAPACAFVYTNAYTATTSA